MGKTLVGMCTFGGLKYTKLAIEGSKKFDVDICVIVGKPGDFETEDYLNSLNIPYMTHRINKGFPASLNDIYDYFLGKDYDNLILQGNDVIPYAHSIDLLIELSKEYDWVSAREVSVKGLVRDFPQVGGYFKGEDLVCQNFDDRPWDIFKPLETEAVADKMGLADCQNLNLYTRKAIEILGYVDPNFYGNGYYCDNDYVRRAIKLNVKSCTSINSFYFHFWSRTIKEELKSNHHFGNNKTYYHMKWGGEPTSEKFDLPYNNSNYFLTPEIELKPDLKISSRELEPKIIEYWSRR